MAKLKTQTVIKKIERKLKPKEIACVVELPALNLQNGRYFRVNDYKKLQKIKQRGYIGNYALKFSLIQDDSPLKRIMITRFDETGLKGQMAMSIVELEKLIQDLPEFLAAVKSKLMERGEHPKKFEIRKVLGRGKTRDRD